jgi:hypothetical protein
LGDSPVDADAVDVYNWQPVRFEIIEVTPLMQSTSLNENLKYWIPDHRLIEFAFGNG